MDTRRHRNGRAEPARETGVLSPMPLFSMVAAARAALPPSLGLAALAAASLIAAASPSQASHCSVWTSPDESRAAEIDLSELPEAVVMATMRCGDDARDVAVWTLKVDASAPFLGVRDAPLFQTSNTGPLRAIAEADIPGAAHLTVFVRAHDEPAIRARGDRAPSHRRFATFCFEDHHTERMGSALDCSLKGARVKARATAKDVDMDGVLDVMKHEVSLYLGGDRLHVVFFSEPFRSSALSSAAPWIDVLTSFGVLKLDA